MAITVSERSPAEEGDLAAQIVNLRPRLLRFAWSLTRDREAAEDLAQETIARAAGTRPALVSIEELGGEPAGLHDDVNRVEARVIARADLRRIADVYRTLPPAFAGPLFLTAIEELSYAEAASILDIPVGTVMSRVYRARRLLIARLARGDS